MTGPSDSSAQDVVRRLLAGGGGASAEGGEAAEADVAAIQRVLERASTNLRGSFGEYGSDVLLARALQRTEQSHPALHEIRRHGEGKVTMDAVSAGVDAHGQTAVRAALEALLAELVEILNELIGADMAGNLLAYDAPPRRDAGGGRRV